MSNFEFALRYVLENEGGWSDDPDDRGGLTRWGITHETARRFGYDVSTMTKDQAALIYRAEYFTPVEWIPDARVAAKAMDIFVNVGVYAGAKILQRATRGNVMIDGIVGHETKAAFLAMPSEDAIERLSQTVADYYVDICRGNPTQLRFLKGWMRRAIRRPVLETS